jgi:uncharacterized protein
MSTLPIVQSGPWHRQRWPWFLMLGPAIVLVAGAYTAWLAYHTDDGLVARNYYKRGLLINRTLQRDHNAAALKIFAQGAWNADGRSLSVQVRGLAQPAPEPVLRVVYDRTGAEHIVRLRDIGGGRYEAALARPADARWRAVLETDDWRLTMVDSVPGGAVRFVAADP